MTWEWLRSRSRLLTTMNGNDNRLTSGFWVNLETLAIATCR
jgi:hypothetical protein